MSLQQFFSRVGRLKNLAVLGGILLLSVPAQAQKTLMFMMDFWGQRDQTDTIINLKVKQSTEISYLAGGGVPAMVPVDAYETEKLGWWYAIPNFRADDYLYGRIRPTTTYLRGWYQWDTDKYVPAGDTVFLPDTMKTFSYQNMKSGQNVTVTLPATAPKFFVFPDSARYKAPKLYTAQGNSEAPLLNQRPTDSKGGSLPGNIDRCVDSIPGDTVWIRFGAINSNPGQQPTVGTLRCTSYNPYSTRAALVWLRNPWPGAEQPVVEFNGQNVPLYPSATNPDWLVADLRYIAPLGTPSPTIRFKQSANSNIYFDSAGVEQGVVKPFVLPALTGGNYYFVPPEAGGELVMAPGTPPTPKYYIYVQNPWKPGSPRLLWESDKGYHVMRPTQSCGWFRYPVYTTPTRVLIGHSFEDSTYGTTGVQFRGRENWIDIPAASIVKNNVYIQTRDGSGNRIPATITASPDLRDCSTDTLRLVMQAYDFKGRGETGGNPAFQVGGIADTKGSASSGLVKGMVKTDLDRNTYLPVYTGRDSGYQAGGINSIGKGIPGGPYGKSTPSNWFDTTALKAAVPGIAIGHTCLELPLARGVSDSGYYKFNDQNFFPLDTISDKRGVSLMKDAKDVDHNFLFCLHGHAAFEYTPGLKFEFRGDDDVWVFVNNKLAVDLGGTHAPESASINLDKMKLREGSVYPFDIFYCERQTNGSSILIRTTMDLQPTWRYRANVASSGGAIDIIIEGEKKSNYVPSCASLRSGESNQWVQTDGRMVVIGPDGSDLRETYLSDVSLYGGNLTYNAGAIKIDTNKLKDSPDLQWPGTYMVRVESRLGDSLYAIKFTKTYGAVVVNGTVLDGDGDGVADSIRLVAPMPIFNDNPSYHLVWFNAAGAKDSVLPTAAQVRKVSDSIVVASLAGKNWGRRTDIPAGAKVDSMGAILTHPAGLAKAVVNPIKIADGIAPVADSARLSFGVSGARDTLRIWVSERAAQNMKATAADFWAKVGRSSAPRNLVVQDGSVDGRLITLLLAAGHGILPADSARVAGIVADAFQNGAANSSVWVPIRSNAQGSAALFDGDGDGQADSVSVYLRGSLSGVASVVVSWKDPAGAVLVKTWPVAAAVSGGFGVKAPVGDRFPKGATSCPGGGCAVSFLDASGKTLEVWGLIDSVAPMATHGRYAYGTTTDTLFVKFSEPLLALSNLPDWLEWGASGALAGSVVHYEVALTDSKDSAVFLLDTLKGIRSGYDSIRIASSTARITDASGAKVGVVSPWAPLQVGLPPMVVFLRDPNGEGRATFAEVVPLRSVPAAALATASSVAVHWSDANGKDDVREIPFASLTYSGTTWSGLLPVPFAFGVTSCASGNCLATATSTTGATKNWSVVDGVQPTLVRARYRFSGQGVNADTLILRSSEPWVGANPALSLPFAWVGNTAMPRMLPALPWSISVDGMEASVVLDSLTALGFSGGDSARYIGGAAAQVVDANGNRPLDVSPWRPIEFGLRPPTLVFAPFPPGGVRDHSKEGAWEPPPSSTPSTEIFVFESTDGKLANASTPEEVVTLKQKLVSPEGLPPVNNIDRMLAVRILLNRPLEGQLIIYDNIGTHVSAIDLTPMRKAWLADSTKLDQMREVWLAWNGTDGNGKFVASGVYLFRAVVKIDNGDGNFTFKNLVWKLGWHRDIK